jgi:hypothetical protein
MTTHQPQRSIFVLRLVALPNVDEIKALRFALKSLLRRYGLRCVSIEVETSTTNHTNRGDTLCPLQKPGQTLGGCTHDRQTHGT